MLTHCCQLAVHDPSKHKLCTGKCSPHGNCSCSCHTEKSVELQEDREEKAEKAGKPIPRKKVYNVTGPRRGRRR
jgi:hypothetical protein